MGYVRDKIRRSKARRNPTKASSRRAKKRYAKREDFSKMPDKEIINRLVEFTHAEVEDWDPYNLNIDDIAAALMWEEGWVTAEFWSPEQHEEQRQLMVPGSPAYRRRKRALAEAATRDLPKIRQAVLDQSGY